MQYLSDEWIQRADAALATAWSTVTDRGSDTTTVAYEVTAAPTGKVAYHLHFGPDGAGVASGPGSAEPDARMTLDYGTAVEIATGGESAQAAFMQGRLKLDGDVTVLIRRAREMTALGDALAALRADTDF